MSSSLRLTLQYLPLFVRDAKTSTWAPSFIYLREIILELQNKIKVKLHKINTGSTSSQSFAPGKCQFSRAAPCYFPLARSPYQNSCYEGTRQKEWKNSTPKQPQGEWHISKCLRKIWIKKLLVIHYDSRNNLDLLSTCVPLTFFFVKTAGS